MTEGAVIGAVSHGVGKWADKKLAKASPSSQSLSQGKNIDNPAHSAAQYEKLKKYYRYSEKYGKAGVKDMSNGKYRFYGKTVPATKSGEMMGRRYVREWDYLSGKTRGWHETLDHFGNVRQVRPDTSITGGQKVHYCFNKQGKYTGKW